MVSRGLRPVEDTPEAEIRTLIAGRGQITFAEFVSVALYHPSGGYYSRAGAVGAGGDYYTSPSAHPAFGALIAIHLEGMWELLGRPHPFHAVEMGAGSGLLARDAIKYAERAAPEFAAALRYVAVDRYAPSDGWSQGLDRLVSERVPVGSVVGCLLSNELVDAMPTHRFRVENGSVREVFLAVENGELTEVLGDPSSPEIEQRLRGVRSALPESFEGEVCLESGIWMRSVADALKMGFVLTIDYGYEAAELYAPSRSKGTLKTYFRHTETASPYERIGRQDIMAHVDFSYLTTEGEAAGLRRLGLLTQSEFLRRLGFDAMMTRVRRMRLPQAEHESNVMAMRDLVKHEGLGGFRVLIQERASGVDHLSELFPPAEAETTGAEPPLLRTEHIPLLKGRYPHAGWDPGYLWPGGGEDSP